jgi:hypothetical protein
MRREGRRKKDEKEKRKGGEGDEERRLLITRCFYCNMLLTRIHKSALRYQKCCTLHNKHLITFCVKPTSFPVLILKHVNVV